MGLIDVEDEHGKKEILEITRTQLESISTILDDSLSLQKMEEGKFEIAPKPFDLEKELSIVSWSQKKLCDQKGIQYSCVIESDLPKYIVADKYRLRQVLLNLVSNAMKFTDRGGRIELRAVGIRPNVIRISVRDSGIGISPENLRNLFQPYSQVGAGRNQKGHGTGLGLSISKKIIQMHNGTMGVESELRKGSCFWLELPLSSENPVELQSPSTEDSVSFLHTGMTSPEKRGRTPKILIVDDSSPNRMLLEKIIHKLGYDCRTACDGSEVVEFFVNDRATAESFDAIIMDEEMDEMNGHVATKEIRRMGFDVPVIALTGYAFAEQRTLFEESGANFFLSKPVTVKILKETLEKALQ